MSVSVVNSEHTLHPFSDPLSTLFSTCFVELRRAGSGELGQVAKCLLLREGLIAQEGGLEQGGYTIQVLLLIERRSNRDTFESALSSITDRWSFELALICRQPQRRTEWSV